MSSTKRSIRRIRKAKKLSIPVLRNYFPAVINSKQVCLDNAAMTQLTQVVIDTAHNHLQQLQSNASRGVYQSAEVSTLEYQQAKKDIAIALNTDASQLAFSLNTTAALNYLAKSLIELLNKKDTVLVSQAEHHSNFLPWQQLCHRHGINFQILPLLDDGSLMLDKLNTLNTDKVKILCLQHASNVTGYINKMPKIADWCQKHNILLVVDGAQMLQHKIPDITNLGVDAYAFSSHKCYSLSGLGVLWLSPELINRLKPSSWGGGMVSQIGVQAENTKFIEGITKFEAGTPTVMQSKCLASAIKWFNQLDESHQENTQRLYQKAFESLAKLDNIRILNPQRQEPQLPIISFIHKNLHAHDIAAVLANQHIAVRAGHHCAQPLMQHWNISSCVRISLSIYNNDSDIDAFIEAMLQVAQLSKNIN